MTTTSEKDAGVPPEAHIDGTREAIVRAAFETLREEGFAGATSRAIAKRGGFNSALIFYYFGSVHAALLAALDQSSEVRLGRYRTQVMGTRTLDDLVVVARKLYREDLEEGHITVFSQLVGASLAHPEMKAEIMKRAEPWLAFVQEAVLKFLAGTAFEALVDPQDLAWAILSLYMGINLLTILEDDDTRSENLFANAERLTPLLSSILGG